MLLQNKTLVQKNTPECGVFSDKARCCKAAAGKAHRSPVD
jgi:hypothetical protein